MKNLFVIRGIPGSGKSTFAEAICDNVVSNDDYFVDADGNYNYDKDKHWSAIKYCQAEVEKFMKAGQDVAVANTFIKNGSMRYYAKLAEKYDYRVFVTTVENRHGGESVHDVPESAIDDMKSKFGVQL